MPWLTVAEVAAQLRMSRAGVYRLIRAGRLPAYRVGAVRGLRVNEDELARYLASRRTSQATESAVAGGARESPGLCARLPTGEQEFKQGKMDSSLAT